MKHRIKARLRMTRNWYVDQKRKRSRNKFVKSYSARSILVELDSSGLGLGAIWLQALYFQDAFQGLGLSGTVLSKRSPYSTSVEFDPFTEFWNWRKEKESEQRIKISGESANRELMISPSYHSFPEVAEIWSNSYEWQPRVEEEFCHILGGLVGKQPFISLHYRGTDKGTESNRVNYDDVLSTVESQIAERPNLPVLIFSDESQFVEAAGARLKGAAILVPTRQNIQGGQALHLNAGPNGPDAAWDAAFAVYAFSKSEVLIKTPSTLSGFAPILNPNLQVIPVGHLRKDFSFFPDRLIHETR